MVGAPLVLREEKAQMETNFSPCFPAGQSSAVPIARLCAAVALQEGEK